MNDFLNTDFLSESLVDRVLQMDNIGWKSLNGLDSDEDGGLSLTSLKEISVSLRELTGSHPLFRRGAQLRNAYIFGRGMQVANVDKPRHKSILKNRQNVSALWSVEAYEVANMALFNDGVFIVAYDSKEKTFTVIPLRQIEGVFTNPNDAMDIWYIKRAWSANGVDYEKWYPTSRKKNPKNRLTVNDQVEQVDLNVKVFIKHANRQAGWTFGVPDSLPALIWTLAYSGYLQDSAKLVHALSKFAWKATNSTARGTQNVKTKTVNASDGVGGVVSTTGEFGSVGVPSAQVNFNNGQPLAALVAASFGVPVIALLSSPGATGGSYGAAQTLDAPTLKGFEVLQYSWASFFEEILHYLGAEEAFIAFPAIETDAVYRQISSIAQAVELGIIWPDEARGAVLDLMDIEVMHDDLPPKPQGDFSVVSKQGDPADGVNGATSNPQGDTNHDADAE